MIAQEQEGKVEEQREVARLARVELSVQLKRFGLSLVPTLDDPDGEAFRSDPIAQEALRVCRREFHRLDSLRHADKRREASRRYHKCHPEVSREANRRHRERCPEASREVGRRYCERHPEVNKRWYQTHPGKAREIWQGRRARELGAEGSFTAEEFRALCDEFDSKCAYCGRELPLCVDHTTPLFRGGVNFIWNILPACKSCNSSKGVKALDEFLGIKGIGEANKIGKDEL